MVQGAYYTLRGNCVLWTHSIIYVFIREGEMNSKFLKSFIAVSVCILLTACQEKKTEVTTEEQAVVEQTAEVTEEQVVSETEEEIDFSQLYDAYVDQLDLNGRRFEMGWDFYLYIYTQKYEIVDGKAYNEFMVNLEGDEYSQIIYADSEDGYAYMKETEGKNGTEYYKTNLYGTKLNLFSLFVNTKLKEDTKIQGEFTFEKQETIDGVTYHVLRGELDNDSDDEIIMRFYFNKETGEWEKILAYGVQYNVTKINEIDKIEIPENVKEIEFKEYVKKMTDNRIEELSFEIAKNLQVNPDEYVEKVVPMEGYAHQHVKGDCDEFGYYSGYGTMDGKFVSAERFVFDSKISSIVLYVDQEKGIGYYEISREGKDKQCYSTKLGEEQITELMYGHYNYSLYKLGVLKRRLYFDHEETLDGTVYKVYKSIGISEIADHMSQDNMVKDYSQKDKDKNLYYVNKETGEMEKVFSGALFDIVKINDLNEIAEFTISDEAEEIQDQVFMDRWYKERDDIMYEWGDKIHARNEAKKAEQAESGQGESEQAELSPQT